MRAWVLSATCVLAWSVSGHALAQGTPNCPANRINFTMFLASKPQGAAGCAMTSDFIHNRPEVAKHFAGAWAKAIDFINKNPDEARKYLAKNTFTPDNVVDMVSMLGYVMADEMTAKQIGDLQKLADFGNSIGVVPEKADVTKVLQKF